MYRKEILGAFLFDNLTQVRAMTQEWINLYNRQRPHDSLNGLTPERFIMKYGKNSELNEQKREINYLNKFAKQA